jgi:hypothetical protein
MRLGGVRVEDGNGDSATGGKSRADIQAAVGGLE